MQLPSLCFNLTSMDILNLSLFFFLALERNLLSGAIFESLHYSDINPQREQCQKTSAVTKIMCLYF